MKIIRFHSPDGYRLGVQTGDAVVDLSELRADAPRDLTALLALGPTVLAEVKTAAKAARSTQIKPLEQLRAALPITNLSKFICLGLNYQDHVAESKNVRPQYPTLFLRVPSSLVAHGEPIERPLASIQLDYEAELAVIIGRSFRNAATAKDALGAVAGYACFNDGSVREFQRHTIQWTMGKNFDRTGGFGPFFVSADELPSGAAGLKISTRVNGETRQSDNTANMIFNVGETLSYISRGITLAPGDVVAMGTPAGVAHTHTPPKWLRAGDMVEVEIEGIGVLRNPVIDEVNPAVPEPHSKIWVSA
jgi:acylpyruvate hydrolase